MAITEVQARVLESDGTNPNRSDTFATSLTNGNLIVAAGGQYHLGSGETANGGVTIDVTTPSGS